MLRFFYITMFTHVNTSINIWSVCLCTFTFHSILVFFDLILQEESYYLFSLRLQIENKFIILGFLLFSLSNLLLPAFIAAVTFCDSHSHNNSNKCANLLDAFVYMFIKCHMSDDWAQNIFFCSNFGMHQQCQYCLYMTHIHIRTFRVSGGKGAHTTKRMMLKHRSTDNTMLIA